MFRALVKSCHLGVSLRIRLEKKTLTYLRDVTLYYLCVINRNNFFRLNVNKKVEDGKC